jgi:hypothetical protein
VDEDVVQPLSPQRTEQASDSSPSREQNFSPDKGSGEAEGVHDDIMDFLVAIEADKQESVGNQYRLFPYQMKWI